MKWIGLTGGIGTGKSTVAEILRDLGLSVVDADEISHRSLAQGTSAFHQIVSKFGDEILDEEGNIDRKVLGQKVFSNQEKLRALEKILHPEIRKQTEVERSRLEGEGEKVAFYDVPLLYEKNLEEGFDAVLVVTSSEMNQIERIKKRNGWSESEIRRRMGAQIEVSEKAKRADFVIENNESLEVLKNKVEGFLKEIL